MAKLRVRRVPDREELDRLLHSARLSAWAITEAVCDPLSRDAIAAMTLADLRALALKHRKATQPAARLAACVLAALDELDATERRRG